MGTVRWGSAAAQKGLTMARVTPTIREDARLIAEEMAGALAPLQGTRMLVTGVGGFLCSYLLDTLAALNDIAFERPCKLVAMDNFKSGLPERIEHLRGRKDIQFLQHDVTLPFPVEGPFEWIVHGAGIASPTFYRRFPLETIDVNVTGLRNCLDLARQGAQGVLSMSTSEIYGDPDPEDVPTKEDYRGWVSCTGPRACYDESKRLGETLCMAYHRLYGTPVKTIRPFNVYGPGQRLDDRRILPDLMAAALAGGPLVLLSDGKATRAFCYIRDAIRGMLYALISAPAGEAYNVGNDRTEVTIRQLAEVVRKVARPQALTVELRRSEEADYLTDNPQRRCPNIAKLTACTPWRPQVDLEEGVARTLRSYREEAGKESAWR